MRLFKLCIVLILSLSFLQCQEQSPVATNRKKIIEKGKPIQIKIEGKKWKQGKKYLEGSGRFNTLYADQQLNDSIFQVHARLSLAKIDSTTALFSFFNNHFGFDSTSGGEGEDGKNRFYIYSPDTGFFKKFEKCNQYINPGVPFDFKMVATEKEVIFSIDSAEIARIEKELFRQPFSGGVGFRPWRNTIKLYDFHLEGNWNSFPEMPYVFQYEELGYHCFRNPSIVKTKDHTLLAFAQARWDDCHDLGDRDLMVKRSTDQGKTWSKAIMIFDDGKNTCTGPVPIVDEKTGRISLIMTRVEIDYNAINELGMSEISRDVFISYSTDDGLNWTRPNNISKQAFDTSWDIIATGPGAGMQMQTEAYKGRMIVPCYHRKKKDKVFYSHAMYSDDGGNFWQIGKGTPLGKTTECKITELKNGELFMSMRQADPSIKRREVAISKDGGITWEGQRTDSTLIDSGCQGSLTYFQKNTQSILFVSNPNSEIHREKMTITSSYDNGKTWTNRFELNNNPAAYSDLIILENQELGCFYEHGFIWPYQGLLLESIPIRLKE